MEEVFRLAEQKKAAAEQKKAAAEQKKAAAEQKNAAAGLSAVCPLIMPRPLGGALSDDAV